MQTAIRPFRLSTGPLDMDMSRFVGRMGLHGVPVNIPQGTAPCCTPCFSGSAPGSCDPNCPTGPVSYQGAMYTPSYCGYYPAAGYIPASYASAASQATAAGYSVAFNAYYCGVSACVMVANPDGTVTNIDGWQVYPPTRIWGPDSSFIAPPATTWAQQMLAIGAASAAQYEQMVTAAVTQGSQASCAAAGGTWNPSSSSCTIPNGPAILTAQQKCLQAAGVWNPVTGACDMTGPVSQVTTNPSNGTGGGSLAFVTSRSGSVFQPGDTWTLRITGAAPNSPVSVYGGLVGSLQNNSMGTTDGQGNWSKSGTFDSSTFGTWQETWYVGGKQVGSQINFSVAQPGTGSVPTGGGTSPGSGTGTAGGGIPSTIFGINSTYVLAGGAALVLLLAMGGRR